jgi:hypothetical protein
MNQLEKLKFPIGEFQAKKNYTSEEIVQSITIIREFPSKLKGVVQNLNMEQLNTAYRPDGWTIRQVIHHCADSHMNSFIRFKLALTEDKPIIKPYFEDKWAEMIDYRGDIQSSLLILEGLHARWSELLSQLNESELKREFIHPEHHKQIALIENIIIYAWHCDHHLAHITELIKRKNWNV